MEETGEVADDADSGSWALHEGQPSGYIPYCLLFASFFRMNS